MLALARGPSHISVDSRDQGSCHNIQRAQSPSSRNYSTAANLTRARPRVILAPMPRHSPRHDIDNWLDRHGYRHEHAGKPKAPHLGLGGATAAAPVTGDPRRQSRVKKRRESVVAVGYALNPEGRPVRRMIDFQAPGDHGADPVGDGTFKMIPSGDIVSFEERNSGGHGRDAADQPAGGFDEAFLDAFHRIDARSGGHNYVLLYDLREALSDLGVGREAFDSGVNQLRRRRIASLDSADGRHVRLSKEQMGAAIREGDSILVYAALRR